jgi:hypothetical protein
MMKQLLCAVLLSLTCSFPSTAGERKIVVSHLQFELANTSNTESLSGSDGRRLQFSTGPSRELWAPVTFPEGAVVTGLEMAYQRSVENQGGLELALEEWCEPDSDASCAPADPNDILSASLGNGFNRERKTFPDRPPVDLRKNYFLRLMYHDPAGTFLFKSMTVFYTLPSDSVGPLPTFSDVPADHPFRTFIEAMAASGMTAGCGDGKFCPDAPLTRGQAAVFFSTGLDLISD